MRLTVRLCKAAQLSKRKCLTCLVTQTPGLPPPVVTAAECSNVSAACRTSVPKKKQQAPATKANVTLSVVPFAQLGVLLLLLLVLVVVLVVVVYWWCWLQAKVISIYKGKAMTQIRRHTAQSPC